MSKYHRTIILVEVLTDDGEYNPDTLAQIHQDITEGSYSGQFEKTSSVAVSPETMATLLEAQGSDPGFYGLTANGTPDDELSPAGPIG